MVWVLRAVLLERMVQDEIGLRLAVESVRANWAFGLENFDLG